MKKADLTAGCTVSLFSTLFLLFVVISSCKSLDINQACLFTSLPQSALPPRKHNSIIILVCSLCCLPFQHKALANTVGKRPALNFKEQ